MKLKISSAVSLPAEAVTSTIAILAKKGAGKTYTGSVMAEEMLSNGIQVVIVDATGAWYGLKSSADGHGPGYPVAILGGDRADVPLEHTAGEVTAEAIVEGGFSCILDLSGFSKSKVFQFMAPFLATLYLRNKHAMHLLVDEADIYAPQKTWGSEDAKCLGAMQDVVRRGRIKGIGITMITQRAQVLNKDVLTSTDILFALRMNHQLDLKAIREWVNAKADPALAAEMEASLPSLPTGDAWVWAPELDIFARTTIRRRTTFDSSATPKPGQRKQVPKVFAPIDLEKLGERIRATVEEKKANDPAALKARIRELERAAAKPVTVVTDKSGETELREQLKAASKHASDAEARCYRAISYAQDVITAARETIESLSRQISEGQERIVAIGKRKPAPVVTPGSILKNVRVPTDPPVLPLEPGSKLPAKQHVDGVSGPMMNILEAVARLEACGIKSPPRLQVALFAGYSNVTSGGFARPVAAVIEQGYAEGGNGSLRLTDQGRAVTRHVSAPGSDEELHQRFFELMGPPAEKMLRVLIKRWPKSIARADLAAECGYSNITSGGFVRPLSRLIKLGLAEIPAPGEVVGSNLLFLNL